MLRRVVRLSSILIVLLNVGAAPVSAQTETIDELYKKALKEDGVLNCYCSLAQINAEKIYPVFEKRFPGIKINHVDATSDKLSARAITEARGGKTFADVVEFGLEDINKIYEQGLILEKVPPEVAAYPANLRGSYWAANNLIFFVGAWNTAQVKKDEEPKFLDDFGDPRWKGRLIAEPRDYEFLVALNHKHKSLEKARAVLARIAANQRRISQGSFATRGIAGGGPGRGLLHLLLASLSRTQAQGRASGLHALRRRRGHHRRGRDEKCAPSEHCLAIQPLGGL
jgi:ABC-type Fe3+ transport system, periplasmic component